MHNTIALYSPNDAQLVPKQWPPANFPAIGWAWCHMVWNIHWASWGPGCVSSISLCTASLLTGGMSKSRVHDSVQVLLSNSQKANGWLGMNLEVFSNLSDFLILRQHCVINIILILNLNHGTILSLRKSFNCIPANTRTEIQHRNSKKECAGAYKQPPYVVP